MGAYDEIWGVAEDNYGIITSAQAKELGVSRQNMMAMLRRGVLTRLAQGVYQVKHHVPGVNDVYAVGVAMVGSSAYLRGASVIAMLNLAPPNPGLLYVGSEDRVRRRLPDGFRVRDRTVCQTTEYGCIDGEWDVCLVLVSCRWNQHADDNMEWSWADRVGAPCHSNPPTRVWHF